MELLLVRVETTRKSVAQKDMEIHKLRMDQVRSRHLPMRAAPRVRRFSVGAAARRTEPVRDGGGVRCPGAGAAGGAADVAPRERGCAEARGRGAGARGRLVRVRDTRSSCVSVREFRVPPLARAALCSPRWWPGSALPRTVPCPNSGDTRAAGANSSTQSRRSSRCGRRRLRARLLLPSWRAARACHRAPQPCTRAPRRGILGRS